MWSEIYEWVKSFYGTCRREVRLLSPNGSNGKPLVVRSFTPTKWEDFFSYTLFTGHSYAGVNSIDEFHSGRYSHFFIDVDTPDKTDLDKAIRMTKHNLDILDDYGIPYVVLFSGKKGFHIHMFTEDADIGVNNRYYRDVVTTLYDQLGLEYDKNAVDRRRVSRIPYSLHPSTKLYVIPVRRDEMVRSDFSRSVRRWATYRSYRDVDIPKPNKALRDLFRDVMRRLPFPSEYKLDTEPISDVLKNKLPSYPPCMRRLVDMALEGENLSHHERFALATFLLRVEDYETVMKIFSYLPDFDPSITSYQLDHIKSRGYVIPSCHTLGEWGVCPVVQRPFCPFYPSIMRIIKAFREVGSSGV